MSLLRKIRSIIFPPRSPSSDLRIPYDQSRESIRELHSLATDPKWPLYQSLLDSIITINAEDLLLLRSAEDIHFLRGYILGLRKAGTIINELVNDLAKEDARIRDRSDHDRSRDRERERLAVFGTRLYKSD